MRLRRVSYQEFKDIYRSYIMVDFPPAERRPLFLLKRLYKKRHYVCYVLERGQEYLGYACFISLKQGDCVLMDYFAVVPQQRNSGIGGKFLKILKESLDVGGIIIESEMPAQAKSPEDFAVRSRRLAFYQRNGARLTKTGWLAFGVHFNLLWYPVRREGCQKHLERLIFTMYRQTLPALVLRRACKAYKL